MGDSLAAVKADELLVIAGHGLPADERIGATVRLFNEGVCVSTFEQTMTANQLADLLESMKLPKGHYRIRVLTCHGAGTAKAHWNPQAQRVKLQDVIFASCVASLLAKAMAARAYGSIMVQGYPGAVDARGVRLEQGKDPVDAAHKQLMLGEDRVSAEYIEKFWFDGTGRMHWAEVVLGEQMASVKAFFS